VVSPSRNAGLVVLDGLAPPGSGKTYQLWLVRSGGPQNARVLEPGQRAGTVTIGQVSDATAFAVSLEQAGGSRTGKPTTVLGGVDLL
jgi:anti-sigma-K factor RskA